MNAASPGLDPRAVAVGDVLPRVELDLTLRRMIVNVGAGWDFFPGHHDPAYAREHGHPTVFANTSFFLALADRVVTDWAGPRARILRRSLRMTSPAYAGDAIHGHGTVIALDDDGPRVEVDVEIGSDRGPCASARAVVELAPLPAPEGPVPCP